MSVSVLPASPALGAFGPSSSSSSSYSSSAMPNGVSKSQDDMSVAEIKERAKAQAQKVTRGASPLSLIGVARTQIAQARAAESSGDLKTAYSAYIKAVSLVQAFMGSAELKAESTPGKRGVLWKEYSDFHAAEGRDLSQRVTSVENKLKEMEAASAHNHETSELEDGDDGPNVTSGGSIADRMRALKSAGMSVNTTSKRFSRDLPTASSTPPMSPVANRLTKRESTHSLRSAAQAEAQPPSPSANPVSPSALQSTFSTASSSSHAFVPASALGPPSPNSSGGSSPQTQQFTVSEFNQAFPSIDELEEMADNHSYSNDVLRAPQPKHVNGLPSAMNGYSSNLTNRPPLPSLPPPLAASSSFSSIDERAPSPSLAARQFPIIPTHTGGSNPGMRRGSFAAMQPTPLSFEGMVSASGSGQNSPTSRPSSPRLFSPTSPTVPRKPSNLSLHSSMPSNAVPITQPIPPSLSAAPVSSTLTTTGGFASQSNVSSSPQPDKAELPHMNSVTPKQLSEYMKNPALRVLLIDVRPREEFERGYIKHPGDCLVCLEPSVLLRDHVTAEMIEDSLSLAPPIELTLFKNRDKFDLVVMYDQRSTTHEPQFKALGHAIYETAFHKMLKRMPVLLIGGLQSWKMVVGEEAVGESSAQDDHARGRRHREHKERRSHGTNGVASVSHASGQPPSSREASIAAQRHRSQTESATNSPRHQSLARSDALRFTPEQASTSSRTSVPPLARKPLSPPTQYASPRPYGETAAPLAQSWSTASSSIQYPSFRPMTPSMPRSGSPSVGTSSFHASGAHSGIVSPPPQASINPSPLVRRRSDFIDQSQEALSHSALGIRAPIDYPELHSHIRAPPPIASPSERQDNRLRPSVLNSPRAPIIQSEYPVGYWRDASIQTSGLKNMGNTCYMNSTIQCLIATVPFAQFFLSGSWQNAVNMLNPIGTKGQLANAFARILTDMAKQDQTYLVPSNFRRSIVAHNSQFEGTEQQDCQEFLSFLLGGLHEDLNRILKKPNYTPTPEREAELERLPVQIASEQEWSIYRMRDDSLIVDLFQGQFRNRLQCMTCHNTSTTYNAFMYLTLPIPTKNSKVSLYQCLDTFVSKEIMEKDDAWNCPHCKTLRSATKQLLLSRLPPVLLIHLKRFSSKGNGADKIESLVDFPLKSLDLTHYMPTALPPGVDKVVPGAQQLTMDDPRNQIPPYKYDLYGVTNHFGSLTSGHYTAFIANRGGWLYADDSKLNPVADPRDVVGKPAYVLYYKRVKA